jgi:hypothetical protein
MKRIISFSLVFGLLIVMPLLSGCASAPLATSLPTPTSTPFETLTPGQDSGKQQLINEVIPLFEIGTSQAYAKAWNKLRLVGNYQGKYWNDEEIQALLWFSYDMINVANGHVYSDDFSLISPAYAGIYHEQISSEVLRHITMAEWQRRYEENSPIIATIVAKARLPLPAP